MNAKMTLMAILLLLFSLIAGFFWLNSDNSSGKQLYFGQVVFGQKSTAENTNLFVIQGKDIFLETSGDNHPQSSEKLSNDKVIDSSDSNAQFRISKMDLGVSPDLVSEERPQRLILTVDVLGCHEFEMIGQLNLSENPDSDQLLHFGGPLEFLVLAPIRLKRGLSTPQDIKIYLGTRDVNSNNTSLVAPDQLPPFPTATMSWELTSGETKHSSPVTMDHFC